MITLALPTCGGCPRKLIVADDAGVGLVGVGRLFENPLHSVRIGEKYVRLLPNIEGIGSLPAQSSGYIHVTSTGDVFSFVLFGDNALNFLSAVPAQTLPISR